MHNRPSSIAKTIAHTFFNVVVCACLNMNGLLHARVLDEQAPQAVIDVVQHTFHEKEDDGLAGPHGAMASAGFPSIASQVALAVGNNPGDFGAALKTLGSTQAIRSFAISVVTAGLTSGVSLPSGIPENFQSIANSLKDSVIKTGVSSALSGEKFNLKDFALDVGIDTVCDYVSKEVGNNLGIARKLGGLNPVLHKVYHAGLGAFTGALKNRKDMARGALSGAIGAVTAETVAEAMSDQVAGFGMDTYLQECKANGDVPTENGYKERLINVVNSHEEYDQLIGKVSKMVAAGGAFLAGLDVDVAYYTADNAIENNFLSKIQSTNEEEVKAEEADEDPAQPPLSPRSRRLKARMGELEGRLDESETILSDPATPLWKRVVGRIGEGPLQEQYAQVSETFERVQDIKTINRILAEQSAGQPISKSDLDLLKVAGINGLACITGAIASGIDISKGGKGLKSAVGRLKNKAFKGSGKTKNTGGKTESTALKETFTGQNGGTITMSESGGNAPVRTDGKKKGRNSTGKQAAKTSPSTERPLLPGEGSVGTYRDLKKIGKKGDNLTPNHIPQNAYMKTKGIETNDGVCMMMEQPTPGTGGRHRSTRTYGKKPNIGSTPRMELAKDIADIKNIYKKDKVYTPEIRDSLLDVISKNKSKFPDVFIKKGGKDD